MRWLLILIAGCDPGQDLGYDRMQTECGPDDGLVPELQIGLDGEDCAASAPEASPWIRARFSMSAPEVGVAYEANAGDLSVWLYPSGGTDWESPSSGTLTLTSFTEDVDASGSYSFTLEDDSTLSGSFDASFCEIEHTPCG